MKTKLEFNSFLFDSLSDALALISKTGEIVTSNKSFQTLLGRTTWQDSLIYLKDGSHLKFSEFLKDIASQGKSCGEVKILAKVSNGNYSPVFIESFPTKFEDEEYVKISASQSQKSSQHHEIRQELLPQQSRNTALTEMISAIAHQWRQPLNALAIMVQDVKVANKYGELDQNYLQSFDRKAMEQINKMSKIIDDFRNFFKPDTKKENFALIGAALDVISLINPQLEHYGIRASVYSSLDIDEPGEITIYGYPNEFRQLILNMISNSKDSIVEKKESGAVFEPNIEVEVGFVKEGDKRFAVLKIIDNGLGIKKELLPRVFEPYFTTKEQGRGTGVGLFMAKMIIEKNMGGKIEAKSVEGEWAEFDIFFREDEEN